MSRAQPNIPIKLLLLDTFPIKLLLLDTIPIKLLLDISYRYFSSRYFPLEWVYTKHTFSKTIPTYEEMLAYIIQQGRQQCLTLTGLDCSIIFPLSKEKVEYMFQLSEPLKISLVSFIGNFEYHFPQNKLWDYLQKQEFVINDVVAVNSLPDSLTIFTDGSKT